MEQAVRQAYRHLSGGKYASRPSWLPSRQQDPRWCVNHTHTATGMNYCTALQDQEYIPTQAEYDRAIHQDMQYLKEQAHQECIGVKHGTWNGTNCSR
jgi:hypothetical protein